MDITNLKYMNELAANVRLFNFPPEGLTEQQIEKLEFKYNLSNPFPLALREYLILAGGGSPIIEINATSLDQLQQIVRGELVDYNQQINRPFLAFENWNAGTCFLFIYGDDAKEDPTVWMAYFEPDSFQPNFLSTHQITLTQYVNEKVALVKRGLSPF